jgi:hypothetical protein
MSPPAAQAQVDRARAVGPEEPVAQAAAQVDQEAQVVGREGQAAERGELVVGRVEQAVGLEEPAVEQAPAAPVVELAARGAQQEERAGLADRPAAARPAADRPVADRREVLGVRPVGRLGLADRDQELEAAGRPGAGGQPVAQFPGSALERQQRSRRRRVVDGRKPALASTDSEFVSVDLHWAAVMPQSPWLSGGLFPCATFLVRLSLCN